MPALPIVGMTLHLEFENDPSALKICDISWDEAYPKFFEIQLEPKDYDEDPTTRMVASGWTCEALNPACVGMIGVRS